MARIRRPGEQVTTAPPTRRVPGRNNRGGGGGGGGGGNRNPGLTNVQQRRRRTRGPGGQAPLNPYDASGAVTLGDKATEDAKRKEADDAARQLWSDENQAAYLQSTLGQAHGGLTPGTSYDNWLNNDYIPGQITAYNTASKLPGGDLGINFDEFVNQRTAEQQRLDAQFQYAHRPDTQRELNPFEGGGSHWSWFD